MHILRIADIQSSRNRQSPKCREGDAGIAAAIGAILREEKLSLASKIDRRFERQR
jgi:hypothetical protein